MNLYRRLRKNNPLRREENWENAVTKAKEGGSVKNNKDTDSDE